MLFRQRSSKTDSQLEPKFVSDNKKNIKSSNAEVTRAEEENKSLNLTHAQMAKWLKKYVNNSDF